MAARRWRELAVALSLALLMAACGRPALYSDLTEHQANEVMAALVGSGIDARKRPSDTVRDAWAVHVASADIPASMALLQAQGLPQRPFASLGEVFRKEGFATSQIEEKARFLHAINQELADTLTRLDGVIDARVHVALPDRDPLGSTPRNASASVVVIHAPEQPMQDREIDIKAIVMDGVEGLDDLNRVTVKFFAGPARPAVEVVQPQQLGGVAGMGLRQIGLLLVLAAALSLVGWALRDRLARRSGDGDDAA